MKILFVGDIYGSAGRQIVRDVIPQLKEQEQIDLIVANSGTDQIKSIKLIQK